MMKFFFFSLVVGVSLIIAASAASGETSNKHWEDFKKLHGKSYSPEEEELRKELFLSHKSLVDLHNEKYNKGEVPYAIGINQFSDMVIILALSHFHEIL